MTRGHQLKLLKYHSRLLCQIVFLVRPLFFTYSCKLNLLLALVIVVKYVLALVTDVKQNCF